MSFTYKIKQIRIDQVFVRLTHAVRQPRIDLQDCALHEFGREHCRVSDWPDLITITMQDECRDVELLEVFREIGLRPSLDAQLGGGKASHAVMEPEGFA